MAEAHTRKPNRLQSFDYSAPGVYFVTFCTKGKAKLFWNTNKFQDELSLAGSLVKQCILEIPTHYPCVQVESYAVMPNHVHLLLNIVEGNTASLSTIIGQLKQRVSRLLGFNTWQKSFYDHVVRDESDFQRVWTYTTYNHLKWDKDCFFDPEDS